MGSMFSTAKASDQSETSNSLVLNFRSSDKWHLHFNSVKDSPKLMVIDFAAAWCGPCKIMEPVVRSMAEKFDDVQFVKIDVDELSDVAKEFVVEAMPTFVLVKKGKEVDRMVGANKQELHNKIHNHRAAASSVSSALVPSPT